MYLFESHFTAWDVIMNDHFQGEGETSLPRGFCSSTLFTWKFQIQLEPGLNKVLIDSYDKKV